MSRINHGYKILYKYTINEIFTYLEKNKTLPDELIYSNEDLKDSIKRVNIIKELIDRDGCQCMICKITPEYFALGKDIIGKWHLDLYGTKDKLYDYMFTIDHIHPKSKGGENKIENYQLLCKVCNEKKGDKIDGEECTSLLKYKTHYIDKKLKSMTEQINGFFNKMKNRVIVCIHKQPGFTVGKEYKILESKIRINKNNNIKFEFVTHNDNNEKVFSEFTNFVTKVDYIKKK